jgi:hypothetical protein
MSDTFGYLKLPNRPTLPFLKAALIQIGDELGRPATRPKSDPFSPFGVMDGFIFSDASAEMIKSIRVAASGTGILRFGTDHAPRLSDLPKLTSSASKSATRPAKAKPITLKVTTELIEIADANGGEQITLAFDQLQNVRIDNSGRFFLMVTGESGAPLCLKAKPWIVPALALLMAGAARKGELKELESEIDKRVMGR